VDSPIEAMSKWILDQPDARQRLYVSLGQLQTLPQDWLEKQGEVVVAFSQEVMAKVVAPEFRRHVLPEGESWNQDVQDDLRRRFVQSSEEEAKVTGQQRAKSAHRPSGMEID
jgi:hypothetical protein